MYDSQKSSWQSIGRICAVCGKIITGRVEVLTAVTTRDEDYNYTQVHFHCQSPMPEPGSVVIAHWMYDMIAADDPDRMEYFTLREDGHAHQ